MKLSVIVCTHNPRPDYLHRVLESLKIQTLSLEHWELLLIDNASKESLARIYDLSWHLFARVIREDVLGLTCARIRGFREATAPLIVFVDDDNVLASNYLERAIEISCEYPCLGAWGAGVIIPEFEAPPPPWTKPYWRLLATSDLDRDVWSNVGADRSVPCGAGMCVRNNVAETYAELLRISPLRLRLDRIGNFLLSGGDTDLALTACDMGLGVGNFARLHITHLIASRRLEKAYLLRIHRMMATSNVLLSWLRDGTLSSASWPRRVLNYLRACVASEPDRQFRLEGIRGRKDGHRIIRQWSISKKNDGIELPEVDVK